METDVTTDIEHETNEDVEVDADEAEFEFDDEVGPDDEIDAEDDVELVDELEESDDPAVDALLVVGVGDPGIPAAAVVEVPVAPGTAAALVEPDGDDDVLITDEVEASLDVILAERMRAGSDDDADDDIEDEDDQTPSQLATIIPVRRPEEFLCQSCFLLKPPGQLADADHQLCRDCA